MTKLYVTAPDGRRIAGRGSRAYGEYFELPDNIIAELSDRPDFSLQNPIKEIVAEAAPAEAVPADRRRKTEDK